MITAVALMVTRLYLWLGLAAIVLSGGAYFIVAS